MYSPHSGIVFFKLHLSNNNYRFELIIFVFFHWFFKSSFNWLHLTRGIEQQSVTAISIFLALSFGKIEKFGFEFCSVASVFFMINFDLINCLVIVQFFELIVI